MLAHEKPSAVHAGEDQSSPEFAARQAHWHSTQRGLDEYWSRLRPNGGAPTLAELAAKEQTLRPGDHVFITRRHVLTEDELNAAARAMIGGQS